MDEHEITNRLAITNLDFDSVNLSTIFRIFESVIGPSIVRISLFGTERSQQYAIAEFTDKRHAKDAYDSIDGLEIEATGNIFDLSFVPADFKGDTLLDDCSNPCGYENTNKANKRCSMDESLDTII
ncbi:uncharacterized protein VICG_00489 [Vittaforma corneae ATCC 50505]|uniref:RRM domain-containing protein n=1 Tax=Vittaforma corneae (strain ATCC 50505) TaxID=993615 RepID=L2GPE9_VITCO|nr:uncharacterized protein VICG_00489 [Vittaforma corneae ATCC 50505]ELA42390.1 hypothetical protein VICG_00489 [Vittaforma corneae ATCC 50505]